jgi:hypothetical protein
VRPSVPALLVLQREVRPASNEQQVEASAEGKTRGSGYAGRHRVHLSIDKGARSRRSQGAAPSSVTASGRIDRKPCGAARAQPRGRPALTAPESAISHHHAGRSYHAMLSVLVTHRARDPPFGAAGGCRPSSLATVPSCGLCAGGGEAERCRTRFPRPHSPQSQPVPAPAMLPSCPRSAATLIRSWPPRLNRSRGSGRC